MRDKSIGWDIDTAKARRRIEKYQIMAGVGAKELDRALDNPPTPEEAKKRASWMDFCAQDQGTIAETDDNDVE